MRPVEQVLINPPIIPSQRTIQQIIRDRPGIHKLDSMGPDFHHERLDGIGKGVELRVRDATAGEEVATVGVKGGEGEEAEEVEQDGSCGKWNGGVG